MFGFDVGAETVVIFVLLTREGVFGFAVGAETVVVFVLSTATPSCPHILVFNS